MSIVLAVATHPAFLILFYPVLLIVLIVAVLEFIRAGQDDDTDYDVADYASPVELEPVRRFRPELDRKPVVGRAPLQILPPAPAGMDAGSPLYARLTAQLGGEPRYVLTAREWLRELGEQARTVQTGVTR